MSCDMVHFHPIRAMTFASIAGHGVTDSVLYNVVIGDIAVPVLRAHAGILAYPNYFRVLTNLLESRPASHHA